MHIVCTVGLIQYWYKGIHTLMLRGLHKRSMCAIKLHEQFSAESFPLKEQQSWRGEHFVLHSLTVSVCRSCLPCSTVFFWFSYASTGRETTMCLYSQQRLFALWFFLFHTGWEKEKEAEKDVEKRGENDEREREKRH